MVFSGEVVEGPHAPVWAGNARAVLVATQTRITKLEGGRDRLRADLGKVQERFEHLQGQLVLITYAKAECGQVHWWHNLVGKGLTKHV